MCISQGFATKCVCVCVCWLVYMYVLPTYYTLTKRVHMSQSIRKLVQIFLHVNKLIESYRIYIYILFHRHAHTLTHGRFYLPIRILDRCILVYVYSHVFIHIYMSHKYVHVCIYVYHQV